MRVGRSVWRVEMELVLPLIPLVADVANRNHLLK